MNRSTVAPQARTSNLAPPVRGPKRPFGARHDPLEQEADRVADRMLAASGPSAVGSTPARIQRYTGQGTSELDTMPASVDRVLASTGRPLEPTLRQDMEQYFGYDFSHVRVHSGEAAEHSAREVSANAYAVGHNIVFGAGRFAPETAEGRRLIAHELTHVMQQSGAEGIGAGLTGVQRQSEAGKEAPPAPDMMRIYSFGPTGAGRMKMSSGTTLFTPTAPVDAKGNELARAGTPTEPIRSRFGRYFTLDERHRPYPPPVPSCSVRAVAEWKPDDGSASSKDQQADDATRYYAPGEPLGTTLNSEYIFPTDRPGVLTLAYVFTHPALPFLLLSHGVHFVNDSTAPPGATVATDRARGPGPVAAARPEANAAAEAPARTASGAPEKGPGAKTPPDAVGQIKELTELIKKTTDAATRDILVRKLRDFFSGLQPFIPAKDAKQMIDEAIGALVQAGSDKAIMAILQAITGKSPTTMPENRNQTGPDVPQRDLGEHILQGPKITIKDAPARAPRLSFEYRNGLQKSYEAGAVIRFTLVPPDNFSPSPGTRLVIVAEAERNTGNAERFASIVLESASPRPIELRAPQKPGKYVIRVDTGFGFDYSSMQEFEVGTPQKK